MIKNHIRFSSPIFEIGYAYSNTETFCGGAKCDNKFTARRCCRVIFVKKPFLTDSLFTLPEFGYAVSKISGMLEFKHLGRLTHFGGKRSNELFFFSLVHLLNGLGIVGLG